MQTMRSSGESTVGGTTRKALRSGYYQLYSNNFTNVWSSKKPSPYWIPKQDTESRQDAEHGISNWQQINPLSWKYHYSGFTPCHGETLYFGVGCYNLNCFLMVSFNLGLPIYIFKVRSQHAINLPNISYTFCMCMYVWPSKEQYNNWHTYILIAAVLFRVCTQLFCGMAWSIRGFWMPDLPYQGFQFKTTLWFTL